MLWDSNRGAGCTVHSLVAWLPFMVTGHYWNAFRTGHAWVMSDRYCDWWLEDCDTSDNRCIINSYSWDPQEEGRLRILPLRTTSDPQFYPQEGMRRRSDSLVTNNSTLKKEWYGGGIESPISFKLSYTSRASFPVWKGTAQSCRNAGSIVVPTID